MMNPFTILFPDVPIFLDVLTCWILLAINFSITGRWIPPFSRPFSTSDASLGLPHTGNEHVTDLELVVFMLAGPLILFCLCQWYERSLMDLRIAVLSVAESITVASTFARWIKLAGRYRPDYLARLETGDSHLIADGKMSFPSEHTTYSFASMTVVFWYLIGKTRVMGNARASFPLAMVTLSPIWIAAYVGITRTMDNLHHFSDVLAGAILGAFCGTFVYFLNYPNPYHAQSNLPKVLIQELNSTDEDKSKKIR